MQRAEPAGQPAGSAPARPAGALTPRTQVPFNFDLRDAMGSFAEPVQSIHQVYCGPGEDPALAQGSGVGHVAYDGVYWPPLGNNLVKPLLSGEEYFKALVAAIDDAASEVLIAGWQINWDAQMDARGTRLFDVIYRNLFDGKKNLKVYIMPWDDAALRATDTSGGSLFLDNALGGTHAFETYKVFTKLDAYLRSFRRPRQIFIELSKTRSDWGLADAMFSHHQKQVVVDRKVAFVGGIDLAYGRFDDDNFGLAMNGRIGLNRYNGCIARVGGKDGGGTPVRTQDLRIDDDVRRDPARPSAFAPPEEHIAYFDEIEARQRSRTAWAALLSSTRAQQATDDNLCARRQWRMPWQDLQQEIRGPAVLPLRANFVRRWNIQATGDARLTLDVEAGHVRAGVAECTVQVLRSASDDLCEDEVDAIASGDFRGTTPTAERCSPGLLAGPALFRRGVSRRTAGLQDDILRAMRNLIEWAQHYIYIENQFFVSDFGLHTEVDPIEGGLRRDLGEPGNDIVACLARRIDRAIQCVNGAPFHVYIVLPVHSEGRLDAGAIRAQVHFTMQTLAFGSKSLVKRVMASLVRNGRNPAEWTDYLTLLNLRTWGQAGGKLVTEQVYVHTKLMIVDDRFVLHGSANINDRSLLGTRDSEIAILVHDSKPSGSDLDGRGTKLTLSHAADLRTRIWRKLFALGDSRKPGELGPAPATELATCLPSPAKKTSWQAIQQVAKRNQTIYANAFKWIPQDGCKIWPVPEAAMPFDARFFTAPSSLSGSGGLSGIKGFITALPILWTRGQNNRGFLPTPLVATHEHAPEPPSIG